MPSVPIDSVASVLNLGVCRTVISGASLTSTIIPHCGISQRSCRLAHLHLKNAYHKCTVNLKIPLLTACGLSILLTACSDIAAKREEARELAACQQMLAEGLPKNPETRDVRFLGKVSEAAASCRGGQTAVEFRVTPWVDWSQYWGTGDIQSLPKNYLSSKAPAFRGVSGALFDLELQRVELIEFNLFDNDGTYKTYVSGSGVVDGRAVKVWPEMRLPKTHPNYQAVGGAQAQECKGELIRGRTTTGICNDILNPRMGSTGTPFARNVEFETSFPDLGQNDLTRNRHGNRLGLLTPDPQVISRKLLTRIQSAESKDCNAGFGAPDQFPQRQLRLPEGAVLQRPGRVLDSVHDA